MADKKVHNIKVEIRDDVAPGIYANIALIAHTPVEFILDFGANLPLKEGVQVNSRIIMCPEHAKRLLLALQENVENYEQKFGTISLHRTPTGGTVAPFGMPTPMGEA